MPDEIYWDRATLVSYLAEHFDVPSKIAQSLNFIEGCFILAATDGAKAYILEVSPEYSNEDLVYLTQYFLETVDVPVTLVPAKSLTYKATVTAETLGFKERVKMLRDKIRNIGRNNG